MDRPRDPARQRRAPNQESQGIRQRLSSWSLGQKRELEGFPGSRPWRGSEKHPPSDLSLITPSQQLGTPRAWGSDTQGQPPGTRAEQGQVEDQSGAGRKGGSQHSRSKVSKSLPPSSFQPDDTSAETRQKEEDWHNNIATGAREKQSRWEWKGSVFKQSGQGSLSRWHCAEVTEVRGWPRSASQGSLVPGRAENLVWKK